jgi:DNA-binding PadR family transcriptional regulator
MYRIDRLDFYILTAFKIEDEDSIITLDKPIDGITISEIMEYLSTMNIIKNRRTIYLHLNKLTQDGYTAKGIISNHAYTYYITDKGVKVLKGELL